MLVGEKDQKVQGPTDFPMDDFNEPGKSLAEA